MTKKGFTLIELLAVILILGIIALIAIPTVNNIINEAKRGSFKITMQNIVKAVETNCQLERLKGDIQTTMYTFSNEGVSPSLDIKGKLPIGGTITVDNECNATINNVTDGKYRASKSASSENLVIAEIVPKVCSATSGDGSNIGDVITCGTESFYVYDTTGDTIKMLAKYNLKVGKIYTSSSESTEINSNEEGYGLQNAEMIGYLPAGSYSRKGTTAFSSEAQHGTNNSTYEGSIVEEYVNSYKETLTNMGVTVEEARLITKPELEELINDGEELSFGYINEQADALNRSWIYSTSYWSGSANDNISVWRVGSVGGFYRSSYSHDDGIGVRPVVIISKSEI